MQEHEIYELAGLRIDGRRYDEIRPMDCRLGFISHVDGSAYLEHGLNKVLAMVVGPHEPKRRGDPSVSEDCVIECQILHAPFSRSQRKKRSQVISTIFPYYFVCVPYFSLNFLKIKIKREIVELVSKSQSWNKH